MARPKKNPEVVSTEEGEASASPKATRRVVDANYIKLQYIKDKTNNQSEFQRTEPLLDKNGNRVHKRNGEGELVPWNHAYTPKVTDFSNTIIEGQDFRGEKLQGLILKNSIVRDNDFSKADLRWADFTSCEGLEENDWEGANVFEAISASGKRIDGENIKHPWQ